MKSIVLLGLAAVSMYGQPVEIRVDAASTLGPYKPIYAYFGYDEPNYTYMQNGRKLIGELQALSPVPVEIRAHHLLVTGDGTPALKWGSTNAYTEDADGKAVYDWTIVDRIFDTYIAGEGAAFRRDRLHAGGALHQSAALRGQLAGARWRQGLELSAKGLQQVGRTGAPVGAAHGGALRQGGGGAVELGTVERTRHHLLARHAGGVQQTLRLHVGRGETRLPTARVGGPGTTGPGSAKAAAFLKQFLEHCARGDNAATGKRGAPLDFITYHAKGSPKVVEGHVQMGLNKEMVDVQRGLELINEFPQFRALAHRAQRGRPGGLRRLFGAHLSAEPLPQRPDVSELHGGGLQQHLQAGRPLPVQHEGHADWAFEFEGQPYFDGFRTLATNGVDKPVLNFFRMAGMMKGDRVKVESAGGVGLDKILAAGVRDAADIDGMATRADREMAVLVWNYHDDELAAAAAAVRVAMNGIPKAAAHVLVQHYRIDDEHSNAYTVWKQLGLAATAVAGAIRAPGGRRATATAGVARVAAAAGRQTGAGFHAAPARSFSDPFDLVTMSPNAFIGRTKPPTDDELSAELGVARVLWDELLADLALPVQEWNSYSPKAGWSLKLKLRQAHHRVSCALPWQLPGGLHTRREGGGGSAPVASCRRR